MAPIDHQVVFVFAKQVGKSIWWNACVSSPAVKQNLIRLHSLHRSWNRNELQSFGTIGRLGQKTWLLWIWPQSICRYSCWWSQDKSRFGLSQDYRRADWIREIRQRNKWTDESEKQFNQKRIGSMPVSAHGARRNNKFALPISWICNKNFVWQCVVFSHMGEHRIYWACCRS